MNIPADEFEIQYAWVFSGGDVPPPDEKGGWVLVQITPVPVRNHNQNKVAITHVVWTRRKSHAAYR